MFVVPSWQFWAPLAVVAAVLQPAEAQDESVVEPLDLPHVVRSIPFKSLGPNPYLHHQDYESAPIPPVLDTGGRVLVVPNWEGFRLARATRLAYWPPPTDEPAVAEVETWAPFAVYRPFLPLGRNPYLANTAQDESVVEPLDLPSGVFGRPFKGLGRNPYLQHQAQDESVVEADTFVPRLITHQFKELVRRPQLGWHGAVEGVEQLNDVGGGFQVVVGWDGFSLARATRFSYWHPATAETEAVAEVDTLAQFLVRLPFKGLGPDPYLRHGAQDESTVEPFDLPSGVFGRRFKELGRSPYLWQTAQDESTVEPFDLPHRLVALPFRPLGRNPYLWQGALDTEITVEAETLTSFRVVVPFREFSQSRYLWTTAQDESVVEPFDLPHRLVVLPFKAFGRNPYLWPGATDVDVVVVTETWQPFLVRVPLRVLGRNPYLWHVAQDESVVVPFDLPGVLRFIPFKPLGRNPYLWNTAQDTDAPVEADILVPFFVRRQLPNLLHSPYWSQAKVDEVISTGETRAWRRSLRSWHRSSS